MEGSRRNWMMVARTALAGTAGALALSLSLLYVLLFLDGLTATGLGLALAILLPLAVGLPLASTVGLLRDDLRRLGQGINRVATYDRATGSLNAPVFMSEIERRRRTRRPGDPRSGAFLIVELARLRSLQHRNGFAWSEDAMRVVAGAVRGAVRDGDLVGRLDNSSFGVFLPGADDDDARGIADRIRAAVAEVYATPGAGEEPLAIRVGGVLCESTTDFEAMFRAAAGEVDGAGPRGVALATLPGRA